MSWMDWGDVRKARGMSANDMPVQKDGDAAAIDKKVGERKYRAQIRAEQERERKQVDARRRKAEQDRLKEEAKAQKKETKRRAK